MSSFDPYTKEGQHAALLAFAKLTEAIGHPIEDQTDFSKGKMVRGRSVDRDWSVTVGFRGVEPQFRGYGWKSKKTEEERSAIEAIAERVNQAGSFENLYETLSQDEREQWGPWLRERGYFEASR